MTQEQAQAAYGSAVVRYLEAKATAHAACDRLMQAERAMKRAEQSLTRQPYGR